MLTKSQAIEKSRKVYHLTTDEELKSLPYKEALVYGRVSDPSQIRSSRESIREIAKLVDLAIKDGYQTDLSPSEVEDWLDKVSKGLSSKGVITSGQVTVDIQDLGLSGQLNAEDGKGLANLQEGVSSDKKGTIYLTEGVTRLSRDQDRITPYQLLKMLKEHRVRIRTPDGVWNPAIERDWEELASDFEKGIGERKTMNRRLFRRKAQKASRGEFVGEPVPLGFIAPVTGHKPNGQYEYGKYQVYPPHAEIAEHLLRDYVRFQGSPIKVMRSNRDLVIPFFPPELSYMERLTSLRRCRKLSNGYQISQHLITGLATNVRLIGVWQWGNGEPIPNNHPAAVPEDLFLEAFEIANREGKPKGRAATSEPLEWQGIVCCCNHENETRSLVSRARGVYTCDLEYRYAKDRSPCLHIDSRDLDEPLSKTVLRQLELGPLIEDIISRLEQDATSRKADQTKDRREISRLEKQIVTYKALLPCCVDESTGKVDREKEGHYWQEIKSAERQLRELKSRPEPSEAPKPPDYSGVRDFLRNLPVKWKKYSRSSRNRFLKALIERVELRGKRDLEATIYWKAGFVQKLMIRRTGTRTLAERLWSRAEEKALERVFTDSSKAAIMAALPRRTWKSIEHKALRMKLKRWSESVDGATALVDDSAKAPDMKVRVGAKSARRKIPRVEWEVVFPNPLQQLSSRETGERWGVVLGIEEGLRPFIHPRNESLSNHTNLASTRSCDFGTFCGRRNR